MSTILEIMSRDHRRCDEDFSQTEQLVADGDWSGGQQAFAGFRDSTERHFATEEELLFPRFEQQTGHTMGPTQVMRMEHIQMRHLFEDMQQAIANRDKKRYLGLSETLMMIIQQHNMKEEQMLYPMMDQVIGADANQLLERVAST
ncbi:MAG: hemerythrin domain-containing protein [Gammaproteobacteria bacterium]|nr:hemerythrin domain-containing protein [Gammaproteobacteria bacterium]